MKRIITLIIFLVVFSNSGKSQFIAKPLNFPGTDYSTNYFHILDANHLWLGTLHYSSTGVIPYSYAVHTNDGGNTWIFDSIPIPSSDNPWMSDVFAWDNNTVFYTFTNNDTDGYIWKTEDGGVSWEKKTNTEFINGYADFYHGFTADTGIAVGDPTQAYYEILLTTNGGDTWQRVPSINIPSPLSGEFALISAYSAIGNTLWFSTNKGRCFKSTDRGLHWTVSETGSNQNGLWGVAFTDEQNGVMWPKFVDNNLYYTADGGNSWFISPLESNYVILDISPLQDIENSFVLEVGDINTGMVSVLLTLDQCESYILIDDSLICGGYMSFKNVNTGWISGTGTQTDNIFKYNGILTAIKNSGKSTDKMAIVPNPTINTALLKLPENRLSEISSLRIIDFNGKILEIRKLDGCKSWINLNGSTYSNGIYIIELLHENTVITSEKWIIHH